MTHTRQVSTPEGICVNLGIMQSHFVRSPCVIAIACGFSSTLFEPLHRILHPDPLSLLIPSFATGNSQWSSRCQQTDRAIRIRTPPAQAQVNGKVHMAIGPQAPLDVSGVSEQEAVKSRSSRSTSCVFRCNHMHARDDNWNATAVAKALEVRCDAIDERQTLP
jgi:hypothetical protein